MSAVISNIVASVQVRDHAMIAGQRKRLLCGIGTTALACIDST